LSFTSTAARNPERKRMPQEGATTTEKKHGSARHGARFK
jgi:hypothetical protein